MEELILILISLKKISLKKIKISKLLMESILLIMFIIYKIINFLKEMLLYINIKDLPDFRLIKYVILLFQKKIIIKLLHLFLLLLISMQLK